MSKLYIYETESKYNYNDTINFILNNAEPHEIVKFCNLSKSNLIDFLRHNLEQTLADCSDSKIDTIMQQIKNKKVNV